MRGPAVAFPTLLTDRQRPYIDATSSKHCRRALCRVRRFTTGSLPRKQALETERSGPTFMANTRSAKKMTRKIAHRTEVNTSRRSRMRTFIRKVEEAISNGDAAAARNAFQAAQPEIMRAAAKGVLHKNTASRKVSRLSQRVKALA